MYVLHIVRIRPRLSQGCSRGFWLCDYGLRVLPQCRERDWNSTEASKTLFPSY
jgi:hypothetical protein